MYPMTFDVIKEPHSFWWTENIETYPIVLEETRLAIYDSERWRRLHTVLVSDIEEVTTNPTSTRSKQILNKLYDHVASVVDMKTSAVVEELESFSK